MKFEIDTVNKTVNFSFNFNKDIIQDLKSCDYNTRWNPELKVWIVPVNEYSKPRILNLIKAYEFSQLIKQQGEDIQFNYEKSEVDYAYLKGLTDSKDFAYTPRKYQLEALSYGLEAELFINGDDIGIGKTFESILYAEVTNSFPCLVIVPASVKYNWVEKWDEITRGRRSVCAIETTETKKRKNNWDADVVVINYDIIAKKQGTGATARFSELLDEKWKMVILDEAHFLKEKSSQRSRAAKRILKGKSKIQMLTGTAIMNKPIEIWNLLELLGRSEDIAPDWTKFVQRYCGGYKGKFGWVTDGATNTLELNKKLRENCYIRREKSEVNLELPALTKQIHTTPITNQKTYNSALNDLYSYLLETKDEEAADRAMEAEHLVSINALRDLSIKGKLSAIEKYLRDWKEAGNGKLLVFGLHKEPLEYLSKKFKCSLIAGGVSSIKKQQIVKEFQENSDIFLFGNMQSAGTGIDGLQNVCSNMLILELPWRPSDLVQAIGRLLRSGQKVAVNVTFMLSDKTIDMDMYEMLAEKEEVTEAVNKGKDVSRNISGLKNVMKRLRQKSKG